MRALEEIELLQSAIDEDAVAAVRNIVLAALVGDWLLSLVSSALNCRNLREAMPLEFADVYDGAAYARSQQYARTTAVFSQLHAAFDLLVLLVWWLWFCGFEWLDQLVRRSAVPDFVPTDAGSEQIYHGLLYWILLMGGEMVLELPWAAYSTFVIEERFGFNKTSVRERACRVAVARAAVPSAVRTFLVHASQVRTFCSDRLKTIALGLTIGPIVGTFVFGFLIWAGDLGWLYCWAFLSAAMVLLIVLTPVLILPIFYNFEPLPDGEQTVAVPHSPHPQREAEAQ